MLTVSRIAIAVLIAASFAAAGCVTNSDANTGNTAKAVETNVDTAKSTKVSAEPATDGTIPSGTGVEKEKPAAGKGNVQGKAYFNEQPAAGVEVKLCEKFSQYGSGCGGQTFTTQTDSEGEYLIKDVPPGLYEGLTVQVFKTPFYVFATSGIVTAAKYKIEPDKTYFAPDTHLFKNDLKVVSPKAGSKIAGANAEVKWEPYPDAAYYKLFIHADTQTGAETNLDYVGKRVDGESFTLDTPLAPGAYTVRVEAYNTNDRKLSQSGRDMKFTVTGGA